MTLPQGRKPLTKEELQRILEKYDKPPLLEKKPKENE
jgi:hypothetical protein